MAETIHAPGDCNAKRESLDNPIPTHEKTLDLLTIFKQALV